MIIFLFLLFLFSGQQNILFIDLHFLFHLTQLSLQIIILDSQLIEIWKQNCIFLTITLITTIVLWWMSSSLLFSFFKLVS
jgi:hypothetical protein